MSTSVVSSSSSSPLRWGGPHNRTVVQRTILVSSINRNGTWSQQSLRTLSSSSNAAEGQHEHFKKWGVERIEANGDYRQDAWLESHIGGPLYHHQDSLPRLPVPSIADTLQRFVPTALPLAQSDEERDSLLQAVQTFAAQAQPLQERLEQRAKSAEWKDSSWLQHWWNTAGYLQVRDTVVINVSYFFDFADDPTSATPIQRGAALLTAVAQFRHKVCSGHWPAEQVGKGAKRKPLCSTAYKYLFHACRIPALEQDSYRVYDPALHHHAIVVRKGHFFRLDFSHPVTAQPYSLDALEQALQTIRQQADALEVEHGDLPKLGWLTSQNRDTWAQGREALLQYGGTRMEDALKTLESGAVLLCLDDQEPVSRQETSTLYLHGGSQAAANRWFDKSVQLMVCDNGKAGFLGEHSMMDGMPVVTLANHLTKAETSYGALKEAQAGVDASAPPLRVEPIFGSDLYEAVQKAADLVETARHAHLEWTGRHSLHVQTFHGYGSTFIKQAGYSPDAYVQMAMQLATFRLFGGHQVGTYEATQVRPFLHGRTETTRSVSTESAALCQALGVQPQFDEHDPQVRTQKMDLLQKAVLAHIRYIGLAAQAQGVDRHFLGLAMIASEQQDENNQTLPDLYAHPVFARSKRWRVSTSHLTHPKFENWGYGEVVPDGVGLSYSIHPRHCVFNVTALREHGWTDKLCHLLQEALLELRRLIEAEQAAKAETPSSKL